LERLIAVHAAHAVSRVFSDQEEGRKMELDEGKYYAYAVRHPHMPLSQLCNDTMAMDARLWLRADLTSDRRTRASAINALKRAIEKTYAVKLVKVSTSYDETYGFLPRTEIRYKVER
jgi:hypothetical protein